MLGNHAITIEKENVIKVGRYENNAVVQKTRRETLQFYTGKRKARAAVPASPAADICKLEVPLGLLSSPLAPLPPLLLPEFEFELELEFEFVFELELELES